MKLRIMGSADLVDELAKIMEQAGVAGRVYPSRNGEYELRWYGDIDDRVIAAWLRKIYLKPGGVREVLEILRAEEKS